MIYLFTFLGALVGSFIGALLALFLFDNQQMFNKQQVILPPLKKSNPIHHDEVDEAEIEKRFKKNLF